MKRLKREILFTLLPKSLRKYNKPINFLYHSSVYFINHKYLIPILMEIFNNKIIVLFILSLL